MAQPVIPPRRFDRILRSTTLLAVVALSTCPLAVADDMSDDLSSRTTWSLPVYEETQQQFQAWLQSQSPTDQAMTQIEEIWSAGATDDGGELLRRLTECFALVHPEAWEIVGHCRTFDTGVTLPSYNLLDDEIYAPLVRNNLELLFGQWLVSQRFYNEGLEILENLMPAGVVDPAALLFYRGAAHYWLRNKDEGTNDLAELLEHEANLPRRYARVALMMSQDLVRLEEDSLDEASRIMNSIRVRLDHGRAGKRVRDEESDVISILDKRIDELEKQCQANCQGAGGANQSSNPMEDSQAAGGTGPGDVALKELGEESDWGDLPPAEREQALQQLGKEFPSHYREVIEEYFRKLARDEFEES